MIPHAYEDSVTITQFHGKGKPDYLLDCPEGGRDRGCLHTVSNHIRSLDIFCMSNKLINEEGWSLSQLLMRRATIFMVMNFDEGEETLLAEPANVQLLPGYCLCLSLGWCQK